MRGRRGDHRCCCNARPDPKTPFIRWTYDDVGNRLSEIRPAATLTYTYDRADQLTSKSDGNTTTSYGYDEDGNQLTSGLKAYGHDLSGRLISYANGSTNITYDYDGEGKRLAQTAGSTTTELIWDRNSALPHLAIERNASTLIRRYQHGLALVSMRSGGADYYYHYDGLGSVANVSDSIGAVQWTYTYEPFGAPRAVNGATGAPDNPVQFTGEYNDPANGLYNLRARQYDTADGRFTAIDPVPNEVTDPYVSAYLYVANRPTVEVDPSGQLAMKIPGSSPTASWHQQIAYWAQYDSFGVGFLSPVAAGEWGAVLCLDVPFTSKSWCFRPEEAKPVGGHVEIFPVRGGIKAATRIAPRAGKYLMAVTRLVRGGKAAKSAIELPAFTQSTIDEAITSAGRLTKGGQIQEGARAIAKKQGQGAGPFAGLSQTQAQAEAVIRNILSHPTHVFRGERVIDAYNAAGQGIRLRRSDRSFQGFLDIARRTQ
jgi:RHS repeat-associated protein